MKKIKKLLDTVSKGVKLIHTYIHTYGLYTILQRKGGLLFSKLRNSSYEGSIQLCSLN